MDTLLLLAIGAMGGFLVFPVVAYLADKLLEYAEATAPRMNVRKPLSLDRMFLSGTLQGPFHKK